MIVWNEAAYRRMLGRPGGPVGRFLGRTGARIETTAKLLADSEQLVRTGRYRSSISWQLQTSGVTFVLRVGSALPYARIIERGSERHFIPLQRVTGRALFWTHGAERGWFVPGYPLAQVDHPGTTGRWIIHRAVALVLRGRFIPAFSR